MTSDQVATASIANNSSFQKFKVTQKSEWSKNLHSYFFIILITVIITVFTVIIKLMSPYEVVQDVL